MKTRILLLLMAIFVGNTQGDLQFSQVISVDFYYPAEDADLILPMRGKLMKY